MGKPSKNAFGCRRAVDISQSSRADTRPRGEMTPDGYQAMKAEKRRQFAERQAAKIGRMKPKKKP